MLALLCPAIPTPIQTELFKNMLDEDFSLLIPKNGRDLFRTMSELCFKKIHFPTKALDFFVKLKFDGVRRNLIDKSKLNNIV